MHGLVKNRTETTPQSRRSKEKLNNKTETSPQSVERLSKITGQYENIINKIDQIINKSQSTSRERLEKKVKNTKGARYRNQIIGKMKEEQSKSADST